MTLLALGVFAVPAAATDSHHFAGTFDTGSTPVYPFNDCGVHDLDADADGNVYVLCGGDDFGGAVVKKFDRDGNPVPFTANLPYISGNTIFEDPDPNANFFNKEIEELYERSFPAGGRIAVGTTGPAAGYVFVTERERIEVFNPSGRFVAALQPAGTFGIGGFGAGPEGAFFLNSGFKIDKRDISLTVTGQLYASLSTSIEVGPAEVDLAVDSTGALWGVGIAVPGFPNASVARWEADQFLRPEQESTFAFGKHKIAKLAKTVEAPLRSFGASAWASLEAGSIAVDRSDDSLFVERNQVSSTNSRQILQFSRGTEDEPSHQIAAPIGDVSNIGPADYFSNEGIIKGIAHGPEGTIFAASGPNKVSKFTRGGPLPTVVDHVTAIDDQGHTDVTVRAQIELEGGSPVTGCEVQYGTDRDYGSTAPCEPDPSGGSFTADTAVSAHLTGLDTEQEYHFAFVATNADGTGYGIDRTFTPAAVLKLHTEPATDVTDSSATFNGTLDPDGISTTYHFEYGLAGDPTDETEESAPLGGSGTQQISVPVTNLAAGKEYQFRLVATNSLGTTLGPVQTFVVAGPPTTSGVHAEKVLSTEADLKGRIDTIGYPTTYQFEYGTTTGYGSVAPVSGNAGEALGSTEVSQHLSGLEPGRVYHFRLVATNKWGSTASDDTTFNFLPAPCPNEYVRQQMKSSFLPDCRAYELVSPENVEGAQIYPGNEALVQGIIGFGNDPSAVSREIQNTGLANSPSRFAYYAGLGAIGDLRAPNSALDQYTATRTNQGWTSTYSGLSGSEAFASARKVCSITLDKCLDHFLDNAFTEDERPRNSGALFELDGHRIGPAPTNWETVDNGERFRGEVRPSPDFSHLVFSARDAVFAPGGQTASPGSVYDNNLATGEVKLISLMSNEQPIPAYDEGPYQFITIPPTGVSEDGSHILMSTHAPEEMRRLYMRVDDAKTYEIGGGTTPGEGAPVTFIGMTKDGSKVLFLTNKQLQPADSDESADVYMWRENGGDPTLTLLSKPEGAGSGDACKASWTGKCSVKLLETEAGDRTGFGNRPEPGQYGEMEYQDVVFGGTDDKLSSASGGVFFFSPEVLAGSAPRNGKNLYLANGGAVHYVTTLGPTQTIDRIQISPDGEHAGFLTRARLTGYDNEGLEEMYSYTPGTGVLKCVSCLPSGAPPTADVEASQNGPFMSNDGRLFFATADALVPADSDPYNIPDVYEYAQGRPQLISSGTSSNGKAPGGALTFMSETLGLESVSSSGQDVFFSTTDTLVPQDSNGHFAKIYDARTNGGFPVPEEPAPCVAADECHGPGSSTPPPLGTGTGSATSGGNVPAGKPKHKKHKAKKRHGKAKKKTKKQKSKQRKKQQAKTARGGAR